MEIISRILEAVNGGGGASRTRIMYNAFVSHAQMRQYLSALEDSGMLHYDLKSQTFKITEKGTKFLRTYREIGEMIKVPPQHKQYSLRKNYPGEEEESLQLKAP